MSTARNGSGSGGFRPGSAAPAARGPVPPATVARLPLYLRALTGLLDEGAQTVSSGALAAAAGVTGAQVRKDLSHLGSYGTRGVGYDVAGLADEISRELGLTSHRCVVLVGVGNLGRALAGYGGFAARGFRVAGLLDVDPDRVGEVFGGVEVRHLDELEQVVAAAGAPIGVLATPAEPAQQVCDRLVACGVTSILNFAPVVLSVPEGVELRKVDLAVELQILSFHEARRPDGSARTGATKTGATRTDGAPAEPAAPLPALTISAPARPVARTQPGGVLVP